MAAEDPSFSDVVQDILRNVKEIVRSEMRLAKAEIGEEAASDPRRYGSAPALRRLSTLFSFCCSRRSLSWLLSCRPGPRR
jgi:hypothetical protein